MIVSTLIEKQQLKNFDKEFLLIMNNPRFKKVYSFLKNNKRKGTLLDIGCGTGDFAAKLKSLGYKAYGLELEKKAIISARKKGVISKQGSFLTKIPYKNSEFDYVFAGEVIEHTVDDDNFLREVNRILKPGGLLILTTPNLVSLGNRFLMLLGFMPRFAYQEFHYRIYNFKVLKNKLTNANFEIEKVSSGHILISTYFNKYLGFFGELLANFFPTFGEQFIIYARKS